MFRLLSCSLFCLSSVGHVLVLSAEPLRPLSRSLPLIVKLIALNEWLSGLTAPLRHTLYLLSRFNLVSAPDTEQLCVLEPAGETADTEMEVLTQRGHINRDKPSMGRSPQSDARLLRLQYCGALTSCRLGPGNMSGE